MTRPADVDIDALNSKVIELEKRMEHQARELADLTRTVKELQKRVGTSDGYSG